jgi:hypothetical protein
MRQIFPVVLIPFFLLFLLTDLGYAQVSSKDVKEAIRDAVGYLKKNQRDDGTWMDWNDNEKFGVTALTTFALLNTGLDSQDPVIQKALRALKKMDTSRAATYTLSFQTMVLCLDNPKANLPLIQNNVDWFENRQWKGNSDRAGG